MNVSNYEKMHLTKQFYPAEFYLTHDLTYTPETHTLEAKPIENTNLWRKINQVVNREIRQLAVFDAVSHKCRHLEQKMDGVWMTEDMAAYFPIDEINTRSGAEVFQDIAQIDRYKQHIPRLQNVYGKITRFVRNVDELKNVFYLQFPRSYERLTSNLRDVAEVMKEYLELDTVAYWEAAALLVKTTSLLNQSAFKGGKLSHDRVEELKGMQHQLHFYAVKHQSIFRVMIDPDARDNHNKLLKMLNDTQTFVKKLLSTSQVAKYLPANPITVRFAKGKRLVVDHDCLHSLSNFYRNTIQDSGKIEEFHLELFDIGCFERLIKFQMTGAYSALSYETPSPLDDYKFAEFIDNDAYISAILAHWIDEDVNSLLMLPIRRPQQYETAINSLTEQQLRKYFELFMKPDPDDVHDFESEFDITFRALKPIVNRLFAFDDATIVPKACVAILKAKGQWKKELFTSILIMGINRLQLKFHQFDAEGKNPLWDILRNAKAERRELLEYLSPFSIYMDEDQYTEVIRAFPNVKHFDHSVSVSCGDQKFDISLREKHLRELEKLEHLETVTLNGSGRISRDQLKDLEGLSMEWPKFDTSLDFYTVL